MSICHLKMRESKKKWRDCIRVAKLVSWKRRIRHLMWIERNLGFFHHISLACGWINSVTRKKIITYFLTRGHKWPGNFLLPYRDSTLIKIRREVLEW